MGSRFISEEQLDARGRTQPYSDGLSNSSVTGRLWTLAALERTYVDCGAGEITWKDSDDPVSLICCPALVRSITDRPGTQHELAAAYAAFADSRTRGYYRRCSHRLGGAASLRGAIIWMIWCDRPAGFSAGNGS